MKSKKNSGGVRASRDREMFKLIWPYAAHAFYIFPHAFEKGCSKKTLLHWVQKAMIMKTPKDGFKSLPPAYFTEKDLRRCLLYYAQKGALTQVGANQFFRKGW